MARFEGERMPGTVFHDVDLSGSTFHDVNLSDVSIRGAFLQGARLRDVQVIGVTIEGAIEGLVVNGVEVGPLVEAELDRRFPERLGLRSTDPDGLRTAWAGLEAMWAPTMAAALARPEADLRVRVDDEWSFLETLRHLVFATESWLGAGIQGATSFHPIGIAGDWLPPEACGLDLDADPPVAEVVALRQATVARVRDYLAGATQDDLDRVTTPEASVGWPPVAPQTVLSRLHVILNEEWWHHRYAVRDLAQIP